MIRWQAKYLGGSSLLESTSPLNVFDDYSNYKSAQKNYNPELRVLAFQQYMACQGFEASSVHRLELSSSCTGHSFIVPCCTANPGRGDENGAGVVLFLAVL